MGRECVSPHILNSAALLTGKEPTAPIELGTGWTPDGGGFGEQKNNFPLLYIEPWTVKPAARSLH